MALPTKPKATLTERFLEFHRANPEFYKTLVRFSREAKAAGLGKYGMGDVIGRARWSFDVETQTTTDDFFKVNDLVASFYSRAIMTLEPDLDGFFNVRKVGDREPDNWISGVIDKRTAQGHAVPAWWTRHNSEGGN